MPTVGLRLEQAPPLSIPMSFFLTAPVAALGAGGLLLWMGSVPLFSGWSTHTLALTHLGTLGFLTMVMLGALYQMIPVVAGSPVPAIRLARFVHALLIGGVVLLFIGFDRPEPHFVFAAISVLFAALLLFVIPVMRALQRAPAHTPTVDGMRLALWCFLITAVLGLWMAHGHSGMGFPGTRGLWIQVHITFALLGWVGGLITAVSWQVLPMFYLSPEFDPRLSRRTLGLLRCGLVVPSLVLVADYLGLTRGHLSAAYHVAAIGALPALLSVWVLHPLTAMRRLRQRRRKRIEGSLLFWWVALPTAPGIALVAVLAHASGHPYWEVLLGWGAIWGWAGMVIHGMLMRIVPFLVWFHRFARHVGHRPVPSVRGLLPDRWIRWGFGLHLSSTAAGMLAILTLHDWLARLTGLLVLATAAQLLFSLVHVLRQYPPPCEVEEGSA